jgi:F0F1-type ATP synthase assembly protein I
VNLPNLARDLDKLAVADAAVADGYLHYIFRKGALYGLACLLATISFVLLGLALYWLLEQSMGQIGATAFVAIIGFVIAGMVAVVAILQRPGREHAVALEMRRSSIEALEQHISAPSPASALIYPAGEALISSVILPLVAMLINSLRSSRAAKAAEASAELVENKAALPADVAAKS